jgi:prefoldin subunit 5
MLIGLASVNLESLDVQQLSQVKKQLDTELEHLAASAGQLRAAQAKFRDCLQYTRNNSLSSQGTGFLLEWMTIADNELGEKTILVPLTNSLYVRGQLVGDDKVIIDVGTGFFIEKVLIYQPNKFYQNHLTCLPRISKLQVTFIRLK